MGNDKPRRIIFVDKRFQSEFILTFVALLAVGTGIFVLAAYLILDRRLEETYYSAHFAIKSTGEVLLPTLLALSGVFVVVLGVAAVLVTLYVSHHIAGPLYAIRRYLESVAGGDLDFEPKLRARDQTTPLAESLAHALETLNRRLVAIRTGADQLREASRKMSAHLSPDTEACAQCRKEIGELLAREEALAAELDHFRLRSTGDKS